MIKFSENEHVQKLFENAIEKTSFEQVLQSFCNYVCDEDVREFIGYYCDNHDCFPDEDDE